MDSLILFLDIHLCFLCHLVPFPLVTCGSQQVPCCSFAGIEDSEKPNQKLDTMRLRWKWIMTYRVYQGAQPQNWCNNSRNLHFFPRVSKCILLCLHHLLKFYQHFFIQARAWRMKSVGKDQSIYSSISLSCGMNPLTLVNLFIETCNLLRKRNHPVSNPVSETLIPWVCVCVCVVRYYFCKPILSLSWHWDTITQQATLNSLWK